ncbi:MAG: hypothetical protein KAR06_06975 [Deltaproteobacteria bacterium]|nr:hypothetical protein [Deltaproteobacteria bacterium]
MSDSVLIPEIAAVYDNDLRQATELPPLPEGYSLGCYVTPYGADVFTATHPDKPALIYDIAGWREIAVTVVPDILFFEGGFVV